MTNSAEELASVRRYLLSEYKRLYHLTNNLIISDDDNAWHDWTYANGERSAIARIMGYMGMELPDMSTMDEGA